MTEENERILEQVFTKMQVVAIRAIVSDEVASTMKEFSEQLKAALNGK